MPEAPPAHQRPGGAFCVIAVEDGDTQPRGVPGSAIAAPDPSSGAVERLGQRFNAASNGTGAGLACVRFDSLQQLGDPVTSWLLPGNNRTVGRSGEHGGPGADGGRETAP
jgi:hypothetical protein